MEFFSGKFSEKVVMSYERLLPPCFDEAGGHFGFGFGIRSSRGSLLSLAECSAHEPILNTQEITMKTRTTKSTKPATKPAVAKKPVAYKLGSGSRKAVRGVANFFRNIGAGWRAA